MDSLFHLLHLVLGEIIIGNVLIPVLHHFICLQCLFPVFGRKIGIRLLEPVGRFVLIQRDCLIERINGLLWFRVPSICYPEMEPGLRVSWIEVNTCSELLRSLRIGTTLQKSDSL